MSTRSHERGCGCKFFLKESPDIVILAAAKVGGIKANNDYPVEFLLENLRIQNNVIRSASQSGVRKLLFLGSSCIYPKLAPQPIPESALLSGPLEPTNEAYAIAKIAGIKLCQAYAREYGANFISVMPTNLYGPNDNFDLETSHVLAALLRKAHEAKITERKKTNRVGNRRTAPRIFARGRSCLRLSFVAREIRFARNHQHRLRRRRHHSRAGRVNLRVVGFDGELVWDKTKPDGTPRKLLDVTRIRALGWQPTIPLRKGIAQTYEWFLANRAQ